jgi:hypothetical protein
MSDFFSEYFAEKKSKKKAPKVLDNLYKIPEKDYGLDATKFIDDEPNQTNQADILFLPDDEGYKYALVVVDNATRITDAEPLKSKAAEDVLNAFENIYDRKILKLPKRIEVDPGSEFKGVVSKWFKEKNIMIRVGKTARHRQQSLVERRNQIIGTVIHKRQAAEELLTGEPAQAWIDDLPKIIKAMNKKTESQKLQKKWKKLPDEPTFENKSDARHLLLQGTKVRVALERPQGVQGEKLHGKFRSSDIRWDPQERVIRQVILTPGQPPMYLLDGKVGPLKVDLTAYTKAQLQEINPNEEYPESSVIKNPNKVKTFQIQNILAKKKVKGKWMLEIKWRGWKDSTWEPRSEIIKDQPDLVRKFESTVE